TRTRGSATPASTSPVASVDPSSTTTSSRSPSVCTSTLRAASATHGAPLYTAISTETAGALTARGATNAPSRRRRRRPDARPDASRRPLEQQIQVRQGQRWRLSGSAQRGHRDGEQRQQRAAHARARRVAEEAPAIAGRLGDVLQPVGASRRQTLGERGVAPAG